ncbi:hypothetical protein GSUB_17545 (plasmid) [Geoalkalibacter subterraneus]|uniref:Uncharacterized protein n=2 Tax=Geoalkalibacter subterraneus TaxID=483547 RepID=A0A0B5FXG4_9BACT|nr:hypothetical protein GSUB_17545 [Geoalkalibacter subterraneus]
MEDIKRIRKKHGKPFKAVVVELASKGMSRHEAAQTLGMARTTFYTYCSRYGLDCFFEKSPKLRQIEEEYGESFEEVVKGFAEMRYSRRRVASILGLNLSYFRSLLEKYDLSGHFLPQKEMRSDCKGHGPGWPKGKPRPRPPRYNDAQILEQVRKYPNMSMFKVFADIDITTVYRRFGSFAQAREKVFPTPKEN